MVSKSTRRRQRALAYLRAGIDIHGAAAGIPANALRLASKIAKQIPNNSQRVIKGISGSDWRTAFINKRFAMGTNYLTHEGLVCWQIGLNTALKVTNLSGNVMKTANLATLNSSTYCPVPVTGGQFTHKRTTLALHFNTLQAYPYVYTVFVFLIYPKGTWTPGEAATEFEHTIKAQNSSLYNLKVLRTWFIAPKDVFDHATTPYYSFNKYEIDLTREMQQLQASVNKREGLINETDTVPCYLGMCIQGKDDGQGISYSAHLLDYRELSKIPFRL